MDTATIELKLSSIIETVVDMSEYSELSLLIIKAVGEDWKEWMLNYFAHIVYINTEPKQVVYLQMTKSRDNLREKFSYHDYLRLCDWKEFNHLLLLSTYYRFDVIKGSPNPKVSFLELVAPNTIKNPTIFENEYVDRFLKETNGWLIFDYQLMNLYRMATDSNYEQADFFKRQINKWTKEGLQEAENISIFGTTLKSIIDNRAPVIISIYNPSYRTSYILFSFLNL